MNIVARVSTCLGIGHLMRIKWLLLELQSNAQASITLVLDIQKADVAPFIQELVCDDIHFVETASQQDIATLLRVIKTSNADLVILDHYDLDVEYEKQIYSEGNKLAVFDDLGRDHYCDFLFDAKWMGELTQKRYDKKSPAKTSTKRKKNAAKATATKKSASKKTVAKKTAVAKTASKKTTKST